MDTLRRRYSPLVIVCHDEHLDQIYVHNTQHLSFVDCIKKTEALDFVVPVAANAPGSPQHLFFRVTGVDSVKSFTLSSYYKFLGEQWADFEANKLSTEDTICAMSKACQRGVWEPKPYSTLDHPVACIHAASADNIDALKWLLDSQQNLSSRLEPLAKKAISPDILHYFVLVRSADTVGGYRDPLVNELFSAMCRHFGHNTSQIIVHLGGSGDKDSKAWEGLARALISQSLVPFMRNFVNSGSQAAYTNKSPMSGLGFAGKLFSAGKKWFANPVDYPSPASPAFDDFDFLTRRAVDFLFMLGDWSGTQAIVDVAIESTADTDIEIMLYVIRVLSRAAQQRLPSEMYKDIEHILLQGGKSEYSKIESIICALTLFDISGTFPGEMKIAILSRLSNISCNQYLDEMHLARLTHDLLKVALDIRPLGFRMASYLLKKCQYTLNTQPSTEAAVDLLDSYSDLMSLENQNEMLQVLRFQEKSTKVGFLEFDPNQSYFTTSTIGQAPGAEVNESFKSRLIEFCNVISLALVEKVDVEKSWSRKQSIAVYDSEALQMVATLKNCLGIPISLQKLSLEVQTTDEQTHSLKVSDNPIIRIEPNETMTTTLHFMPNIKTAFVAKSISCSIDGDATIVIPIGARFDRSSLENPGNQQDTQIHYPRLCVERKFQSPRLQIEVEGLSSSIFEGQDVQATVIIYNTGSIPANNVILFAYCVADFPTQGIPVGDIVVGSSFEVPIAFQIGESTPFQIMFLAAERSSISDGAIWSRYICPQQCFSIRTERSVVSDMDYGRAVIFAIVKNVSTQFLVEFCPQLSVNSGQCIISETCRLDIPPQYTSIFVFSPSQQCDNDKDLKLFIECSILGENYRFSFEIDAINRPMLLSHEKTSQFFTAPPSINDHAHPHLGGQSKEDSWRNPWRTRQLGIITHDTTRISEASSS